MNNINKTLPQLLLGAGESVDVLAMNALVLIRAYENIAPLVDKRLHRRCILPEPELFNSPHQLEDWKHAILLFEKLQWEVRTYPGIPSIGCVIVDGREALLSPLGMGSQLGPRPLMHFNRESSRFASITDHFEQLWSISAPRKYANLGTEPLGSRCTINYEQLLLSCIPSHAQKIIVASNEFWDRQILYFAENPSALITTNPRHFEELIAELLDRNGLEVELTPPSADGGRDILAWANTLAGRHLYLVECKRYAANRHVGVEIVRALYGVVQAENATAGVIVTTSEFTRGAKQFQETIKHRMDLRGYEGLIEWLKKCC